MYTQGTNGEKLPVSFGFETSKPAQLMTVPQPGKNKTMLYVSLAIGLAVLSGGGFLLYRHRKRKDFGYKL